MDLAESAGGAVVDLDDTGLPGTTDDRPGLCPLGLSAELDASLGGGVASGELAVLLAPPARGKTSYLVAIGAKAAQAGRHVLHVTLEISTRRVGRRYDSTLTGLKSSDLIQAVSAVAAARKQVKTNGGSIHIKDWSYMDVTPNDIRGLTKGMRAAGKSVDLIIVDYLELLTPNSGDNYSRREQRHVYGQLGKQMRAMAVGLDVPVITAWQVNREGSDMHNVELRHISESWDIIKHADQIISMNQTDAERDEHIMRLRVLKQRDSTDRSVFYLHSDLDRMVIRGDKDRSDPIDKPTLHAG
jgi:replicative DNA helicase